MSINGHLLIKLPSINYGSPIKEATKLINAKDTDTLVVLKNKRPVGILSSYDVLERLSGREGRESNSLETIMNRNFLVFETEISVEEAQDLMLSHKHWLAVVTEQGEYRGVITTRKLLKQLN